ncbi:acetylxylan esterase [Fusarium bulbicola]|nr:acetylxylan esterase [Fusarium bulbicola]
MHSSTTTLLLIAATTVNAIGIRDDDCKDVHIFLAKGNNEPYPGRQGKLAGAICSGLKSCDYEDIQFQNALQDPFCDSVTEGVKNGIKQITAYNKKCPDSKLVVSGYSQGAQVVGDILGGGGGVFFQNCVEPDLQGLNPKTLPGSKIVAAMVFGDTRHTKDQPYNVLSGAGKDGLFPRPAGMLKNLASYGDVFRNYCVETDPICAQGDEVETHLNYFDVFTDDVADWVKERVGEDSTTTTTTTAATKTSTKMKSTAKETSTKEEETESTSEAASTTKAASTKDSTTKDSATTAATSTTADASSTTDATSAEGRATAGEASSDAAAPSSTDNAATSKGASLMGMIIGVAALLAIQSIQKR